MSGGDAAPAEGVEDPGPGDAQTVLASFITLLPVEDAAASVLGAPFDIETLVVSSVQAARLEEIQIDLGEGPAWEAFRENRPTQLLTTTRASRDKWPMLTPALAAAGTRTVFCAPLLLGRTSIGAVSLYSSRVIRLDSDLLRLTERLASLLAAVIVQRALAEAESGNFQRDPALSRREVHQATGMVISQTRQAASDALLLIRAHAFAASMSVRDVAAQIIARTLDFTPETPSTDV